MSFWQMFWITLSSPKVRFHLGWDVPKPHFVNGLLVPYQSTLSFPHSSAGKESVCNAGDLGSVPGLGRSPGGGERLPTLVFWPGEFHGLLHSTWGRKESDPTEWFLAIRTPFCFSIHTSSSYSTIPELPLAADEQHTWDQGCETLRAEKVSVMGGVWELGSQLSFLCCCCYWPTLIRYFPCARNFTYFINFEWEGFFLFPFSWAEFMEQTS